MIRIEVTNEDDVLRMAALFWRDDDLRGCDYEIWLVSGFGPGGGGGVLRRWRKDGQQGGAGTSSNTMYSAAGGPLVGGGGAGGTGTTSVKPYSSGSGSAT